jgi:NuA3 HAT complex component NTO1
MDRDEFFKNPVSKRDVPDYFDIVTKPMSWNVIDAKLEKHQYWDIQDFKVRLQSPCQLIKALTRVSE